MVRGPDYRALPPFRALPSKPIAPAEAEKLLTAYIDASEISAHLHPDAVLNPAGVQFSLQGGSQGGITLHNLRRVQAGLRGENLAPEPYDKGDAAVGEDPEPQEADVAVLSTEQTAEELELEEQAASEAIGQDPLQNQYQPSSPPEMAENSESESDFEEDDPSRYISSTSNKGMFSKKKQKTKSDDSRLDAKIREAASRAKRKRSGSATTPDAEGRGDDGPKEKKAKQSDEDKKSKKEAKKAAQKAEKAKLKAEKKVKKGAKSAPGEQNVVGNVEKTTPTKPVSTTTAIPESPKDEEDAKPDKKTKAEKKDKREKKKKEKVMKATA